MIQPSSLAQHSERSEKHRKRGAPLGNQNARKHGFYSSSFKPADLRALDDSDPAHLLDEISLLRVLLRNLVAFSYQVEDFSQASELVRIACLAAFAISRLVKTQQYISTAEPSFADALNQSLSGLLAEFSASPADTTPECP